MRETLAGLVPILTLAALGACGASNPAAPTPHPATWQAPVRLGPTEGAGISFAEPTVGADGTGHAIVTWGEARPSAGPGSRLGVDVRASWFDPASGWGTPATVGGAGQIVPVIATLAMARDGRAVLVWRAPPNAVASFFSPGGSWTPPAVMPVTVFPQLALGPDGRALALWAGFDDPAATPRWEHVRIFSVGFTPEGFTPAEVVVASPTAGAHADIGVDASGNALAAWLEVRVPEVPDAAPSIWTNRLVKGSGWGEAERLAPLPESSGTSPTALDLDVHPDGHAVVAWEGAGGIEASLYGPSGWSTPALIGPRSVGHVRVAMSAGGRAVAIWVDEHGIQGVEFRPGRGWGATQDIDDTPVGEPHFDRGWIELGLDEVGGGWALWATEGRVQAARLDPSGRWDRAVSLQSTDAQASWPRLAVSATGQAFATWAETHDHFADEVWAAVYPADRR
jgi:hypothetical protein